MLGRREEQVVSVKVSDILEHLTRNREEHIQMYEEAINGFMEQSEKELSYRLEEVRNGRKTDVSIHLELPKSYVKDFNRLIKMFSMTTDHEIDITESQFRCYIENEWDWMRQWATSNSVYSPMLTAKALEY